MSISKLLGRFKALVPAYESVGTQLCLMTASSEALLVAVWTGLAVIYQTRGGDYAKIHINILKRITAEPSDDVPNLEDKRRLCLNALRTFVDATDNQITELSLTEQEIVTLWHCTYGTKPHYIIDEEVLEELREKLEKYLGDNP